MKPRYHNSDNIKLTVKPLSCSLDNSVTQTDPALFNEFCIVDSVNEKPLIIVNSAYVNFNVTNEAIFENIEFEGNDGFAFYQEDPNVNQ